ncbi:hypothetical protein THASP1DRAFT_33687 [Thamnocephalis sphaerospora]|uniref:CRIB domain-containing protein n=1 Tax=Thamnocephalis sphaerospora TaxID=78915 RepID=A0A4P9XG46_9FUNG|nr:hypothetical protein THASP1DRAFT_33687 [Thamnocephalis sphaerospora]|eukprot:RKP04538.1 hypothetical protein THASP1DRAFT_33687 [Thamnocephalis sphaerospora]
MTQPKEQTVGCLPPLSTWFCCRADDSELRTFKGGKSARGRKRINKLSIGAPKNFQHTGHIGINSVRRGNLDVGSPDGPSKIRSQLAEVAAILRLDDDTEGSKEEHNKLLSMSQTSSSKE